jgi:hypothetical protein
MAFTIKNPEATGLYSIDYTVGHGAVNMRDDVMLAQVCLNITYFERRDMYAARYIKSREDNELVPLEDDGYCGPLTIARIYQFQNDLARKGNQGMGAIPVKIDGKFDVSPEPGVIHMGTQKRVYSFDSMNYVLADHTEDEAKAHYYGLRQTAKVPLLHALTIERRFAKRFK